MTSIINGGFKGHVPIKLKTYNIYHQKKLFEKNNTQFFEIWPLP